ncbi:B12-binding domain-containing radical SAM protein [Geobacter sp. AOG2]|uniref:B12-binding domain-containing radical SAM protein n=1 Tax=Geobacter sp. AOG2 TaxID=1566347 RepID=UPI001CC79994|nr:radical SAM protein [Geobacter sp. AOG2]GFE61484.1 B12-binding domain-containing radical SAM protein [Geobacter sp. AOG2]
MRITLVSLHPAPSPQAIPLANAFLKGFAAQTSLEVELVEFFTDDVPHVCAERVAEGLPTAIGFSLYLWNRAACLAIADDVRRRLPEALIFAGGPEVTADPHGILDGSALDLVIVGEGEYPFNVLCKRLANNQTLEDIPGILIKGAATPFLPAPPLVDLDAIPSPYLGGILDCDHYPGVLWQLSRGCGFTCDFCFDSRGQHGVRRFSLERIESELRHFAQSRVSQVFVLDSTFNQDLKRAKAILRLIKKIAPGIHFHFEVRSEFIDPELARLFAQITCSLQIGLQSSDSRVLQGVGRSFRTEDFVGRIDHLNRSGATFGFDLIYGLPDDTLTGFRRSLDFALSLYPNHLDIFPLAVLPGTALADRSDAIGLNHLPRPPYTLLSSPTFPADAMTAAQRLATACDIFYTRGRAVAWFNEVAKALKMFPSVFLHRFSEWLLTERGSQIDESDLDEQEVWQLQRGFLNSMFSGPTLKRYLPVVLDLVDYHYHYAAALLSPLERSRGRIPDKGRLLQSTLRLAGSVRLAKFNYEILEILDAGIPDIRRLTNALVPVGSFAAIYSSHNGVCTESLAKPYFHLLERLDGRSRADAIAAGLGLQPDDAGNFLLFALDEGIVLRN